MSLLKRVWLLFRPMESVVFVYGIIEKTLDRYKKKIMLTKFNMKIMTTKQLLKK